MAKAFVDGIKTQTRRLTKGDKTRYKIGDILWIRETDGCIKEMARMFYRVKDVRVEWLQNISIGDILSEGIALKNIDTLMT